MITVSADTVAETAAMKRKHGFGMRMLSDESLAVIRLYNVEQPAALTVSMGRKIVRSVAIPTAILVGADGVVRWIDQADNYQVRSDADRVLAAVKRGLA
jgi:peroxiredoxin